MVIQDSLHFEASARLQSLLGRQLLSNEYVAIAELVKNAWDAGASVVRLSFDMSAQSLTITDDGTGMTRASFNREWMRVGESAKASVGPRGRPLAGEKGIGRFAADKLSARLTLYSRTADAPSTLAVEFNWSDFERSGVALDQVDIPSHAAPLDEIPGHHGTKLVLSGLRRNWTQDHVRELADELCDLVQPGVERTDFQIVVDYGSPGALMQQEILVAPRELPATGYELSFSLDRGHVRETVSRPRDAAATIEKPETETLTVDAGEECSFGPVTGRLFYVNSKWVLNNLSLQPGVRVYRDGFRVEPFGREGDDWLGIQARKASRQGQAPVAPSRLFGLVRIGRKANPELQDVTSREGLVENDAFRGFRHLVRQRFERLASIIEEETKKPEWKQSRERKAAEEEARRIQAEAKTYGDMASRIAHQLRQPLQSIMSEAGTISTRIRDGHIADSVLDDSLSALERAVARLDGYISFIAKAAHGLRDTPKVFDLHNTAEAVADQFRDDDSTITVQVPADTRVRLPEQAVEFVLANLVQNAVREAKTTGGQVRISLVSAAKEVTLAVEDDGPGVPSQVQSKLFTGYVMSSGGMGSGLMDSQVVARAHGGEVKLTSPQSPTRFELTMPQGEIDGQ
jgi:signal transduction histidine kinase